MKVVLLAGGLGTRMREETEFRPKPMVEIGGKPALWHIMKVFAHHGHTDFVICGGYRIDVIRDYFLNYGARNSDFSVTLGNRDSVIFHGSYDEFEWTVTVADTGPETPTGGRIHAIQKYVGADDFLCTYGDGIADVDISKLLSSHATSRKQATVTLAKPRSRFGVVKVGMEGTVSEFVEKPTTDDFVNIGYFVFSQGIFDYLSPSSVLEKEPLANIARNGQLGAFVHSGFWQPMDTLSEAQILGELWREGTAPWAVWQQ